MKRVFLFICLVLIMAFALSGCMGTKDYYTAQSNYYQAQADAAKAYMDAMNHRPPIASMTAPDGTVFIVNQTDAVQVPLIKTTENPIVAGLKTVVNSTPLAIVAGGWTAKQVLQNSQGDIHASGNAQVTSTTNSNNATDLRNSDGDMSEDSSDNSNHSDNSNNSDNSVIDSHDQTAEPTIVTQPPYNDPIIIEQPPYNDPVIVDPTIVYPEQGE